MKVPVRLVRNASYGLILALHPGTSSVWSQDLEDYYTILNRDTYITLPVSHLDPTSIVPGQGWNLISNQPTNICIQDDTGSAAIYNHPLDDPSLLQIGSSTSIDIREVHDVSSLMRNIAVSLTSKYKAAVITVSGNADYATKTEIKSDNKNYSVYGESYLPAAELDPDSTVTIKGEKKNLLKRRSRGYLSATDFVAECGHVYIDKVWFGAAVRGMWTANTYSKESSREFGATIEGANKILWSGKVDFDYNKKSFEKNYKSHLTLSVIGGRIMRTDAFISTDRQGQNFENLQTKCQALATGGINNPDMTGIRDAILRVHVIANCYPQPLKVRLKSYENLKGMSKWNGILLSFEKPPLQKITDRFWTINHYRKSAEKLLKSDAEDGYIRACGFSNNGIDRTRTLLTKLEESATSDILSCRAKMASDPNEDCEEIFNQNPELTFESSITRSRVIEELGIDVENDSYGEMFFKAIAKLPPHKKWVFDSEYKRSDGVPFSDSIWYQEVHLVQGVNGWNDFDNYRKKSENYNPSGPKNPSAWRYPELLQEIAFESRMERARQSLDADHTFLSAKGAEGMREFKEAYKNYVPREDCTRGELILCENKKTECLDAKKSSASNQW